MGRLTQKDAQGNWRLKGVRWEDITTGKTITEEVSEKLYGALWKLMEYEESEPDPEKETPVYFLDTILDELISYCGPEEVRRRLDELTCRN